MSTTRRGSFAAAPDSSITSHRDQGGRPRMKKGALGSAPYALPGLSSRYAGFPISGSKRGSCPERKHRLIDELFDGTRMERSCSKTILSGRSCGPVSSKLFYDARFQARFYLRSPSFYASRCVPCHVSHPVNCWALSISAASFFIPSGAVCSNMRAPATNEFAFAPDNTSRCIIRVRP